MKKTNASKKPAAIIVPRHQTNALIEASTTLTKKGYQSTKKLIIPRTRRIIIKTSQDDDNEGSVTADRESGGQK